MKTLTCLCAVWLVPIMGLAQEAAPDKKAAQEAKLKELVATVQDQIEADPMLKGVMLAGAKFAPKMDAAGEELQLQGKLMDPAQGETVEQLVLKAMSNDPYWKEGEGPLDVSAKSMMVSYEGSPELANRYHAQGLDQFWKGEYAEADRAFSRALAEAPNDDVLRYWLVVSAMAQKQDGRAKSKLAPLLEAHPFGSRTPMIALAFERLQGPMRKQLMAMENELLASM